MSTNTPPSIRNHLFFWMITSFFLFGFIWIFNPVLLPFVLGIALAYLLDPAMEKLAGWKFPRWAAALTILSFFFVIILSILALVLPMIFRELQQLAEMSPDYADKAWTMIAPYAEWIQTRIGNSDLSSLENTLRNNIGNAFKIGGNLVTGLANGGQAVTGFLTTLVITPIVAFFMMKEWNVITTWLDDMLPRDNYDTIRSLLDKMNQKMSGFIRGQLSVALALALIYAIALTIAGLNFGFLVGFIAGLLSIIPMLGSTIGLLVSIVIAWFQMKSWGFVAIIAAIFLTGQFIEGNILTPRLLGKSVGLHPLWILFAVMAGGSLFGLTGMLLAVPVTAIAGVLLSFGIERYKDSAYYKKKTATAS